MADIVILGAGVMGSAMAVPAAHAGSAVDLVGTHLDAAIVSAMAAGQPHPRLGIGAPPGTTARPWTEFGAAMATPPRLLILGVASAGVPWAIDRIVESVHGPVPVLMITKGLSPEDGQIEVLPKVVAREVKRRSGLDLPVMAVGGPCIAGELAGGRDTSIVIAGEDPARLADVLALLKAPFYHARTSSDLVGTEFCAAFKNFYTLAVGAPAGILERAGKAANGALMHNLSSSLFTQALEEMAVLVEAAGGDVRTVAGLPGSGDLYVTCQAGRNGRMGRLLGLGLPYSRAKAEHMTADTVEGAQLALDLGPTLKSMMASGALPAGRLPLTSAIVAAVCRDAPLELAFDRFHRG